MISRDHIDYLRTATVFGANRERIGTVAQVLVDTATGEPEWVSVRTGFFGMNETLVPIREGHIEGEDIVVPFTKDQIKDAPNISPDREISQQQEAQLYSYYGMSYSTDASPSGMPSAGGPGFAREFSNEGSYGEGFEGDEATTRSEEHVRMERGEAGRPRLRKWVATEQVYPEETNIPESERTWRQ